MKKIIYSICATIALLFGASVSNRVLAYDDVKEVVIGNQHTANNNIKYSINVAKIYNNANTGMVWVPILREYDNPMVSPNGITYKSELTYFVIDNKNNAWGYWGPTTYFGTNNEPVGSYGDNNTYSPTGITSDIISWAIYDIIVRGKNYTF